MTRQRGGYGLRYDQRSRTWAYRLSAWVHGRRTQPGAGGFPNKRAAQEAAERHLWKIGAAPPPSALTVAERLGVWLEERAPLLSPATVTTYRQALENHLGALGPLPLHELTPEHLRAWLAGLRSKGLAPGSQVSVWRVLRTAVHLLQARGELPAELLRGVEAPRKARPRIAVWSPEQTRIALSHLAPLWIGAPCHVAATTGLRIGELLALRWEDFTGDALVVTKARKKDGSIGPTKTEESRRVELYPETVAVLEAHREAQKKRKLVLPDWHTDGLIFPRFTGGPWRAENLSSEFVRQVVKLHHWGVPRIRFHDLRHTHASQLIAAGVDVVTVSARLGHSSPATTLRIYAHLVPGRQLEAVSKGSAYLGEPLERAELLALRK